MWRRSFILLSDILGIHLTLNIMKKACHGILVVCTRFLFILISAQQSGGLNSMINKLTAFMFIFYLTALCLLHKPTFCIDFFPIFSCGDVPLKSLCEQKHEIPPSLREWDFLQSALN